MAWLEIHQTFPNHRKTLHLAALLKIPVPHAMGLMTSFWLWALDNAPSGSLEKVFPLAVATAAQWNGDPEELVSAMRDAEYLELIDGVLFIQNWEEYAGKLIRGRQRGVERMRAWREKQKKEETNADVTHNESVTSASRSENGTVLQYSTVQYSKEPKTNTNPYVGQNPPDALEEGEDSTKNDEVTPESAKIPHVPHTKIMDLWNSIVAPKGKPSIKSMTDFRKKALKRMWRDLGEGNDFTDPDVWRQFFEFCTRSEVLMAGGWFTFDWLFKPESFQKIFEGNYHGRRAQAWQERR